MMKGRFYMMNNKHVKKLTSLLVSIMMLTLIISCTPTTNSLPSDNSVTDTSSTNQDTQVINEGEGTADITGTIEKVILEDNAFTIYTIMDDSYYMSTFPYSGTTFTIDNAKEVQAAELINSSTVIDDSLRTSDIKTIDGYMKGSYYVKTVSNELSTVVFIDDEMGQHLDLLEIDHPSDAVIYDVQLTDDFTTLLYSIKSSTANEIYKHQLDNDSTELIASGDTYVILEGDGSTITFDRTIVNNVASIITQDDSIPDTGVQDSNLYDVVVLNGIVTDPDTNTYKFGYNIGITDKKIMTITKANLTGFETIDATGLIVSPGFIDMLGFEPEPTVAKYKITDGVTTNLQLHGGSVHFDSWFAYYENNPPYVNYGGSVFAIKLRQEDAVGIGSYGTPTETQITYMADRVREEIEAGALALSFSPEYYPGTTPEEIRAMMTVAAQYDIPTHFHARYSSLTGEFTGIDGVIEVLGYAKELNAPVQFMHLHSTGGTGCMDEALAMINEARVEGYDVTYDIYPYDSWASNIDWQRYNSGWQERYDITYSDLQMAGTSLRLTEETFNYFRSIGGLCIAFAMDEDEVVQSLSEPYVQIGSDGNIQLEDSANNHFRGAGTFSRVLGKYVRDDDAFSLMDGIRKMTINGAKHLEAISEDMALRGRLQVGCYADITIFDYRTVLDQSTPEFPATASIGIEYVIVAGQIGLSEGELLTNVHAGQPIKNNYTN
jgi:N-acyl-D-aspartate/D-glutamate deacylase